MLYETMKAVGEGVLIAVGLLIAYVLAVVLIDAARARRERREDEQRARRFRSHGVTAIALLLLFFTACGEDAVAPFDPTGVNDPARDCEQRDITISAQRESTRQEVHFFDSGENILLTAVPLGRGGPLHASCDYTRTAAWKLTTTSRALVCREYGEDAGLQKLVQCTSFGGDADLTVLVQHGGFGRSRTFKVVF